MPDAPVKTICAAGVRLLGEPQFRAAATRLGDLVAAEAENSPVATQLESVAADAEQLATVS